MREGIFEGECVYTGIQCCVLQTLMNAWFTLPVITSATISPGVLFARVETDTG